MLTASNKELKQLKSSHLFQVYEFHKMVLALQRFKEENAVKALTGKRNIRHHRSPDKVFFSVLEKMLLEVSCFTDNLSFHKAEQQLLSLRKVFLWFQSNKHVLMKSDGYFKAARKITEDIHEKQLKSQTRRRMVDSSKSNVKPSSLKTINVHLEKLRLAEQDAAKRRLKSDSSMFARSLTQDLTSIDSATFSDKVNYEEDLDFAREVYEHEYFGGNRIEHLNRPMTAPLKLRLPADPPARSITPISAPSQLVQSENTARPQSALTQVKHELSWAKVSPLPLTALIQRNAEKISKPDSSEAKKQIRVDVPSNTEGLNASEKTNLTASTEKPDNQKKIENLFLFKRFCLEHATQQENYSRQFTHHKHGTRQHFLEFPENKTESIVRQTATDLYRNNGDATGPRRINEKLSAYQGMSLEQFLDHDVTLKPTDEAVRNLYDDDRSGNATSLENEFAPTLRQVPMFPRPPSTKSDRVVQPSFDPVRVSSLSELAPQTGKRMNIASEQALSAPKHGWRYPIVPMPLFSQSEPVNSASGVVLALQENDAVQHKVLIPLKPSSEESPLQNQDVQTNFMNENEIVPDDLRPKSSFTTVTEQMSHAPLSRPSTRPWSSPRYITEVRAILRNRTTGSRSCFDIRPDLEHGDPEVRRRPLRCAGASGATSRPRTAASWGSYPAKAEVSRSAGAASHHSTGVLRHRSVAETMRVKSVSKQSMRSSSGRSSASSYVAQLREKKRAGAKLCAQAKPGPRKSSDYDQLVYDIAEQKPHLSFIQIASPMGMPASTAMRTYARPGGVYCGSTAAVVVAREGQVNVMDDASSDGQISYEDYFANTPADASATNKTNTAGDNWLSQWLTGTPLDGLHDEPGNGKATTYADLVSRAAIIDSSDERSYSDDPASCRPAVDLNGDFPGEVPSLSSKEDFSLSPRTDPLLSHRTDTDLEEETHVEGTGYHGADDVTNEASQFETKTDGSSEISGVSSDSLLSSDQSFIFDAETEEGTEEDEERSPSDEEKLKANFESGSLISNGLEPEVGSQQLNSNVDQSDVGEIEAPSDHLKAGARDKSKEESSSATSRIGGESAADAKDDTSSAKSGDRDRLAVVDGAVGAEEAEAEEDDQIVRMCSFSTYDTMTESEAEFVSGDAPVRIVVTSARKVERELVERKSRDTEAPPKPDFLRTAALPDAGLPRLITRDDVSGVASLSRPHSSRPIPSEVEVRDPFVDFVASTRQKQIDRSVDVRSIFNSPTPEKSDVVDEEAKREEQEAAIKMQRAYRRHLARVRAARNCQGLSQETLDWARSYKAILVEKREMRKRRLRDARQSSRAMQRREKKKMNRIGPHNDVFEIYHPDPVFPHPDAIQDSAVEIQKLVRGWLVRRRLKRVKDAAEKRESSLPVVVSEYRALLQRTQRRHGKLKPSLYLTYDELEDYLQQRAKFELVFKKREFWNEMESAELSAFFNDCGLFPSQDEINEAWESISKSVDFVQRKKKHSETAMSKEDVLEVAFHIYVPAGARMEPETTRSSTWMTPIFEGEEGLKLMAAFKEEQDEIEAADFEKVTKFVAQAFKERKKSDKI